MPLSGDLRSIRFDRDADNRVELSLTGDDIKEKVTRRETSTRTVVTSGEITSSLRRGPPGRAVAVGDRDDDRRHLRTTSTSPRTCSRATASAW